MIVENPIAITFRSFSKILSRFCSWQGITLLDPVSAVGVTQRAPQVPSVEEALRLGVVLAVHRLGPHLLPLLDPALPQGPAPVPGVAGRVPRHLVRRDPGAAPVTGQVHPEDLAAAPGPGVTPDYQLPRLWVLGAAGH